MLLLLSLSWICPAASLGRVKCEDVVKEMVEVRV